eukprot:879217_1
MHVKYITMKWEPNHSQSSVLRYFALWLSLEFDHLSYMRAHTSGYPFYSNGMSKLCETWTNRLSICNKSEWLRPSFGIWNHVYQMVKFQGHSVQCLHQGITETETKQKGVRQRDLTMEPI